MQEDEVNYLLLSCVVVHVQARKRGSVLSNRSLQKVFLPPPAAVKVNGKSKAKAGTKVAWLSLYVSAKQPQVFAYKLQMSANSEHGPNQGGKKVALVGTVNTFFVFRNGTVYMLVHVPTRR